MIRGILFFLLLSAFSSCLTFGEHYEKIPPGIWRAVLFLGDKTEGFDEVSKGELPFNFEVVYDRPDSFHIVIHNGEERIVVSDIKMGVNRRTARDTIFIDFPVFDSYITAQYEEDAIEGWWVVRNRKDYRIKFTALHGQHYRFFQRPDPPAADLSGKWDCNFSIETEEPERLLGEFKQDGNQVTGTFLSATGDYRYLDGAVNGDRLFLSVFDGSHAFLYEAKILPDGQLTGIFRSGNHYKTYWNGVRSDSLSLNDFSDPMALTQMKEAIPFSLALPDPSGKMIDINAAPLAGRPKVIQIMGTWCPNCKDETEFLLDYLKQHPDAGFEIIGLSFERYADTVKANGAISTMVQKMKIPYPVVYGGSSDKSKASASMPMLNKVIAYPTMIFLDKNNHVVAIHTGFTGPATSEFDAFKIEFDGLVSKMISGQ